MPRLIVIKGPDEGKQFELAGAAVIGIGRGEGNLVKLHDTEVSRRHAEFRSDQEGVWTLTDLGSQNGVYINNRKVANALLQPGDHVQLGQTILVYSASRPPSAQPIDLAERIAIVSPTLAGPSRLRPELDLSSAIVKSIGEAEGSRILARPDLAATPWLRTRLANLSVMYETVQAVSHILDLDQLLDRIMELVFQSIEADRGCVMLRTDDRDFLPKAVRYREGVSHSEKIEISRTIMDYALREEQGVLVADAAADQRFSSGASIVRYGIHEAICVPMRGRYETIGVLWLDTQSSPKDVVERGRVSANSPATGKFSEDHLALAIAIAHQAALAVEETRYHQALVQSERLAAIGQTVAALSHSIKNILQGLSFGKDMVKMGLAEKNEEYLKRGWSLVEKNQIKIEDLVKDMLSYSKEREPVIESTDLNRVVSDVVELMKSRATEMGGRLETKLDHEMPKVPADREGIHHALLNIVGNALDAVEGRDNRFVGVVTKLEADGQWATISVIDHGPGIPSDKLTEIFKPFVSTKGSKGTGLGLAVSRKILREHGGDIIVVSKVGKGSKFTLRLPMKSPFVAEAMNATQTEIPVAPPEE